METKKKKKRKKNYIMLVVSDSPGDKVKKYKITKARVGFVRTLVIILFVVVLGYIGFSTFRNTLAIGRETVLKERLTALEDEHSKLTVENNELTEKVNILSETVNQKVDAEKEQEEKNIPSGFPLSGTADLEETNEILQMDDEEVTRPIIIFKAGAGTSVVASGGGSVIAVDSDNTYGTQIQVDHGNGYVSAYRSGNEAKVKVGDEVIRGTLLFELGTDEDDENASRMGYQIIKDGEYINPTEVLEING